MSELIINFAKLNLIIMINYKLLLTGMFLLFFTFVQAQKVEYDGKKYQVKGEKIFFEDQDITETLSFEEQNAIKNKLSEQLVSEKKIKEAEKAQKKAEKAQKRAEKAQRKAENELKQKEKARKNYADAQKRYEKEMRKYEKLSKKGKLSPEDEGKWQKKLESLKNKIDKTKRKL